MKSSAQKKPSTPRGRRSIWPMDAEHIAGGGRDRNWTLPQFFTTINQLRTAFSDTGPGKSAERRTLLFVHGLAGNVTHWVNVAPHFVDDYRVVAIDLPGHGETDKPGGQYTIDGYVEHVRELMDRLDIQKATIVGHSMGGMVATAFALAYPTRIDAAILVNPAGMQPVAKPLRFMGHLVLRRALLDQVLPRVWQKGILANVFYEDNAFTKAFIRTVNDTYEDSDVQQISAVMEGLRVELLERNHAELLGKLTSPVWLIWGEQDRLVPARFLRKAARNLPNVRVEEIGRCGHMPIIERPSRVIHFIDRALMVTAPAT